MLTYEKQRILDTICDKKKGIQKQEAKIETCRQKLAEEHNFLVRKFTEFRIEHFENGIKDKIEDIRELEDDLRITQLAILSQQRDNEIIESNDRLPFPKDLEMEDADLKKASAGTVLFSRDFFNLSKLREMIDSFTEKDESKPEKKDRTPVSSDQK